MDADSFYDAVRLGGLAALAGVVAVLCATTGHEMLAGVAAMVALFSGYCAWRSGGMK